MDNKTTTDSESEDEQNLMMDDTDDIPLKGIHGTKYISPADSAALNERILKEHPQLIRKRQSNQPTAPNGAIHYSEVSYDNSSENEEEGEEQ